MEIWVIQSSGKRSKNPFKIAHNYYYKDALINNKKSNINIKEGEIVGAILITGQINANEYAKGADDLTKNWIKGFKNDKLNAMIN